MKRKSRTVLIAGGGITGLTAALAIAQSGFRVDIFEQAAEFDAVGAGLQISPNAFHVLARLGLEDRLKELATGPGAIRAMSALSGREIAAIPLGATAWERYEAPYLVLHRADLQQILARAVRAHSDINLHFQTRMEDFSSHQNGVTALLLKGGSMIEYTGCALVAADGVWSRLRERCFGAEPAQYTGYDAWRALIEAEQLSGIQDMENLQLWLAPDAHAVSYPVRNGRYLNLVVIIRGTTPHPQKRWSNIGYASELLPGLKNWNQEFLSLLQKRTRWTRWPLFHSLPASRWTRGPAALAGDAAHTLLPYAAQGAAMGIEDACILAECLGRSRKDEDFGAAMEEYQRRRAPRVLRARRLAEVNRRIYHMSGPLAFSRNVSMALMGGYRLLARQDWLYGWRCEQEGVSSRGG